MVRFNPSIEGAVYNYENILNEYVETASGYSMEFAIPWSNINTTPVAENSIGFNIAINDDDDENSIFNLPNQPIRLF